VEGDIRCRRQDGVDFYCHPKTYPAVPHRLYRNLGNGSFADVTGSSGFGNSRGKGMGIGIADVDGNGWVDVFIANDTEPNFLFLNRGDGTFTERALPWGVAYNDDAATVSAMGVDIRDYDNDGAPDIFYNNLTTQIWALFRNLNRRSFRYVSPAAGLVPLTSPFSGWSAGFIDYNNDGWRDLYSANGDVDNLRSNAEQHDTLFENRNGRFVDVSSRAGDHFARRGYQRGAAFGDFNNDGFLDIVVTSLGRPPAILINTGDFANAHWLALHLVGTKSNRDSIGAAVKVTTPGGRILHDWLTPSVGFLSSSTRDVHFGLGAETAAEIEVRWPSGAIVRRQNVKADQRLILTEP
jgi:hypothetical protein